MAYQIVLFGATQKFAFLSSAVRHSTFGFRHSGRNSRFSAARIAAILVDGSVGFPDMTIDTLRQVPLFESLDNEAADELCRLLTTIDSKAGAFLFRHGEEGDAMYIIEQGKIRICLQTLDGHQFTLTELGRGDFFGDMALL